MSKNFSPKKVEKFLEGKIDTKKKVGKQNLSGSKSVSENEEIKNLVIEDEKWQCSIVLLVPQNRGLHDLLLQILVNLPENFTVLTKDTIINSKKTNSQNGSKTRTSILSTSKSSKQTKNSKSTKSKIKSKKEKVERTKRLESTNNEVSCLAVCLALKKAIISLRNTDIANNKKNIRDSQTNELESKMKNVDTSRDIVDNQINIMEENYKNNQIILHRFVLLLGFYDPLLPEVLNNHNVLIKAIINVRSAICNNSNTYSDERSSYVTAKYKKRPSGKIKVSVDGKVDTEYSVFYEQIVAFSGTAEFLEKCKDVIFFNYFITNSYVKTKENVLKYKLDILGILHKIKDAWNKYEVYIEAVHVQNIPTSNERLMLDNAKIYNTMILMVPLECTSAAVILHCIVEQVVWWNDDKRFVEETDNGLLSDNSTCNNSLSKIKSFRKNKTPILIHHRDEIKYNTFHLDLPEFDFEQISTDILIKCPVFKLWERYPPHPKPVQKWFEFQLQKLQNLSDSCILKPDGLFLIYLHHLLMDVLIFKTNPSTNSNGGSVSHDPEVKITNKILWSEKEPEVCDSNSTLFIKEIIYNIICKVPILSLCQNYAEVFEAVPFSSLQNTQCSLKQPIYTNRLGYSLPKKLPVVALLHKRELLKQHKLNKLVSFLNCIEIVNFYEDLTKLNIWETNRLRKYEFIEILNTQTMCQCLQSASQTFSNVSYDYFPVTDTILLWFNNSMQDQVLSSFSSKCTLETPLGFRDFYCHILKESMDFRDTIKEEVVSRKSLEEKCGSVGDGLKSDLEFPIGSHSKVEYNKKHFMVDTSYPTIVYNLGSLWMESTESFNNYFSVDSSSLSVKKANYFNNKTYIVVNVKKNNTSVRYELDTGSSNDSVQLFVDVQETLNLNIVLKWDIIPEKSSIQKNYSVYSDNLQTGKDNKLKLNCSLSITLPSGLFIEVVPTNTIYEPFYIRQKYLGKGPNCSDIWNETYRCYFNNGMVLIFRADGSVDILYNNGTTVKCQSLELVNPDNVSDAKSNTNTKEDYTDTVYGGLVQEQIHKIKKNPNNQQKKKRNVKADPEISGSEVDGKETNERSQKTKDKVKKWPRIITENKEENITLVKETKNNIHSYQIVKHSVLSWDGKYSQYDMGNCKGMKKCLSLKTAFDIINHELYWQRSDSMSGLQAPGNLKIKFPDGSKTTSFTTDKKKLCIDNKCAVTNNTDGDFVKVESFIVSQDRNNMGFELNTYNADPNYKKNVLAAEHSSVDNVRSESLQEKSFVFIENSFLMEHTSYASVEFLNEERELKLTLPGNCWVKVGESGRLSFKGKQNERITVFNNSVIFEANVLSGSPLSKSSTTFRFENAGTVPIIFSQTEDSYGNVFSVDERGNTTYLPCMSGENSDQLRFSGNSAKFPENIERFFVFNRDLTGYELIHEVEQANTSSNPEGQTVNTPVVKGDSELFNFYMQSPIYRTKCEAYMKHDFEEVTCPILIRRKDLKAHITPETIWFYPNISSVKKLTEINERYTAQPVKAMMIVQRLKVKKKGIDVASFFSKSLNKYLEINEQIYQKYLGHPIETLKEEDLIESVKNRKNFLGSKSYYLSDNLPVVISGEIMKENHINEDFLVHIMQYQRFHFDSL